MICASCVNFNTKRGYKCEFYCMQVLKEVPCPTVRYKLEEMLADIEFECKECEKIQLGCRPPMVICGKCLYKKQKEILRGVLE